MGLPSISLTPAPSLAPSRFLFVCFHPFQVVTVINRSGASPFRVGKSDRWYISSFSSRIDLLPVEVFGDNS